MTIPETSTSLIRNARESDPVAWQRMVSIYGPVLYTRLRSRGVLEADAADIVQDTFLATSLSLSSYDRNTGPFRAWIWVIARNKMLDHIKRRCHRIQASGGTDAHLQMMGIAAADDCDDDFDGQSTQSLLVHQIREHLRTEFEPKTYQAFLMTTVDELSGHEVAERLGMTVGAVYKAKSRVLGRLRQLMDDPFAADSEANPEHLNR